MQFALRGALIIVASAIAILAPARTDSYSVKRVAKVGDATKYKMNVDFIANGTRGTIDATLLEQVTAVDKDGNFTVQQSQIDASGTYDKEKIDVPARTPISMVYKPTREVTAIKGDLIDANSYRVENLATVVDPGKQLSIGDVWTTEIKEDQKLGTPAVRLEYKLVAVETVAGVQALKIKATGQEVQGNNPGSHDFTIWLSTADGSMVEMDSKWQNAPFPGISSPVSATIKIVKLVS